MQSTTEDATLDHVSIKEFYISSKSLWLTARHRQDQLRWHVKSKRLQCRKRRNLKQPNQSEHPDARGRQALQIIYRVPSLRNYGSSGTLNHVDFYVPMPTLDGDGKDKVDRRVQPAPRAC